MPQELTTFLKDKTQSNELDALESEFLSFFWLTLKQDYFINPKAPIIWLPHIGRFFLKQDKIIREIKKKLSVLRGFRDFYKDNQYTKSGVFYKNTQYYLSVEKEFKQYWALNKKVGKFHIERKKDIISASDIRKQLKINKQKQQKQIEKCN